MAFGPYGEWQPQEPPPQKRTRLVDIITPDELPSSSICTVVPQGDELAWILEVKSDYGKRLGAIVISARGSDPATGRLKAHGVSTFSIEEILKCPE